MVDMDYQEFLESKRQSGAEHGFAPVFMNDRLFDFQKMLVEWAVRKGRAAIFADCGLGKTFMQLVWAENVKRHTNRPVLILTPLAVANQTKREGKIFDIECERSKDGKIRGPSIYISNYERLHLFDWKDFAAVICDESSILKSFDGKRKQQITEFMRKVPYRLLCTATAAPNDYIELGTSSEALGEMGQMDMLSRFFINKRKTGQIKRAWGHHNDNGIGSDWRFKGHAETGFWRWVCTWARAIRKPSDYGYTDDRFVLPALREIDHIVEADLLPDGALFNLPATNFHEERAERRRTIDQRCGIVSDLVSGFGELQSVVWCHLNHEGDLIERALSNSIQVSGQDSDDKKEEAYDLFSRGEVRTLITKPKIGAWGLNWQHCSRVVTFASHSYEQYYQSVRRCWRFGQKSEVEVHLMATKGEERVKANLRRKAESASGMFDALVQHMNVAMGVKSAEHKGEVEIPSWV